MLEKRRINVSDLVIDVRVKRARSDKTFIFIHGIGVSGRYFCPLANELSSKYTVYVLDLPGYGKTPKPDRPLTIDELANVVDGFVKMHDIHNPVLVGQSMGCQIVARVACKNPTKYRKSILIGPTVNHRERNRLMQGLRLLQDTLREPLRLNMIIFTDYAHMGILRYLKTVTFMINDHIETSLAEYSGELLIIRGENDPISSLKWCRYLENVASHAVLSEVRHAAHLAQYTHPKELGATCVAFLEK